MVAISYRLILLGMGWLIAFGNPAWAEQGTVTIYAAASTTNALKEIGALYEKERGVKVISSFAAASALAKQIEQGAPADLFVSADLRWMDYLDKLGKVVEGKRRNLLNNTLVLVAPKGKGFPVRMEQSFNLPAAFEGKWCTGDPASVPVGSYAKQALTTLGWWQALEPRLVGTQDVRSALAFVERGECALGIVYETDAKGSDQVETLAAFPADSHQRIVYPVALLQGAGRDALGFYDFLFSKEAAAVFTKYGFMVIWQ